MSQREENDVPALDAYWLGVTEFLARNAVEPARIIAPREFGPHLENSIPYERAAIVDMNDVDCAVLHKGMLARLPARFLRTVLRRLLPVYANAVFVVYCREIFEPLASAEHVKAFLEQVPDEDETQYSTLPPLAVYSGDGRMICRDPDFRKIVVPARATVLLGALTSGRNPVAELMERLAPILAGAHRIVDYGAGIGLLALAAKEKAAPDCLVLAIEDDPLRIRCLEANIDLAGLYWRVKVLAERPARLQDICRDTETPAETAWPARRPRFDLALPCDALHIDLDFARDEDIGGIAAFLDNNGRPPVILSRGLAGLAGDGAGVDEKALVAGLRPLGYEAGADGARICLGALTVLRYSQRNAAM